MTRGRCVRALSRERARRATGCQGFDWRTRRSALRRTCATHRPVHRRPRPVAQRSATNHAMPRAADATQTPATTCSNHDATRPPRLMLQPSGSSSAGGCAPSTQAPACCRSRAPPPASGNRSPLAARRPRGTVRMQVKAGGEGCHPSFGDRHGVTARDCGRLPGRQVGRGAGRRHGVVLSKCPSRVPAFIHQSIYGNPRALAHSYTLHTGFSRQPAFPGPQLKKPSHLAWLLPPTAHPRPAR